MHTTPTSRVPTSSNGPAGAPAALFAIATAVRYHTAPHIDSDAAFAKRSLPAREHERVEDTHHEGPGRQAGQGAWRSVPRAHLSARSGYGQALPARARRDRA